MTKWIFKRLIQLSLATLLLLSDKSMAAALAEDTLQLPDGTWVIASDEQFRLHRPPQSAPSLVGSNPIGGTLISDRNIARTRQLLSGVFSAAWLAQRKSDRNTAAPQYSLSRYVFSLASTNLTVEATVPLTRSLARRLQGLGYEDGAKFAENFANNEAQHENVVVEDLAALGINPTLFTTALQPEGAKNLVKLFAGLVDGPTPITAIGYMYALQRSSLLIDKSITQKIESTLPKNSNATRTLRIHGGMGENAKHARETEELIATLSAGDRRLVALSVFDTIYLMTNRDDYPGDEAVRSLMQKFKKGS
jgi:hypothetical protein